MFLFDGLPSNLLTYSLKEEAAFVRLHALVRKGYRADLGEKDDTGLISLEHPSGASAGAPTLLLCFDGRIIGRDNIRPLNSGNGDPDCIYNFDEADRRFFEDFLSNVPEPTMLQAFNSMTIWEMKMMIVSILFLGGLAIGLVLLGKWSLGRICCNFYRRSAACDEYRPTEHVRHVRRQTPALSGSA